MSMALRPALALLGAAILASFAAGWLIAVNAKPKSAVASTTDTPNTSADQPKVPAAAEDPTFKTKVLPFLQKYCVECHSGDKPKGGLTLEGYATEAHARKDRKNWLAVQHVIASGEMPPPKSKKPQPTKEEREFFVAWITNVLTKID